jgi:hypothetical protein
MAGHCLSNHEDSQVLQKSSYLFFLVWRQKNKDPGFIVQINTENEAALTVTNLQWRLHENG